MNGKRPAMTRSSGRDRIGDQQGDLPPMMWFVFQGFVMFLVIASNIHWQWTPNGMLAGIIGAGAAWLSTLSLAWLLALPVRRRNRHAQRAALVRAACLPDDASSSQPSLTRSGRHPIDAPQVGRRLRISHDPS